MIFCLTSVLNGMGRHCSFVESLRGASGLVHLGALDPRPVYGGPKATSGPRPALIAARGPSTGARRRTPHHFCRGTTHGVVPGRTATTPAVWAVAVRSAGAEVGSPLVAGDASRRTGRAERG